MDDFEYPVYKDKLPLDLAKLTFGQLLTLGDSCGVELFPLHIREFFPIEDYASPDLMDLVQELKHRNKPVVAHAVNLVLRDINECDHFVFSPDTLVVKKGRKVKYHTSEAGYYGVGGVSGAAVKMASAVADVVCAINKPSSDKKKYAVQTPITNKVYPSVQFATTPTAPFLPMYKEVGGSVAALREKLCQKITTSPLMSCLVASMIQGSNPSYHCFTDKGEFVSTEFAKSKNYKYQFDLSHPPPTSVSKTTLEVAWRTLFAHRAIRGSDKKGISPLLRGSNYGALPTDLQDPLEIVLGIRYMMEVLGFQGLYHNSHLGYNSVIWELLSLNTLVFYNDAGDYPSWESEAIGRYDCVNTPSKVMSLMWIGKGRPPAPLKGRSNLSFSDNDRAALIDRKLEANPNLVVITHATPCLSKITAGILFPTNHPHALDIYVVAKKRFVDAKDHITISEIALRSINANNYRTSFVFHRTPYSTIDPFRIKGDFKIVGRMGQASDEDILNVPQSGSTGHFKEVIGGKAIEYSCNSDGKPIFHSSAPAPKATHTDNIVAAAKFAATPSYNKITEKLGGITAKIAAQNPIKMAPLPELQNPEILGMMAAAFVKEGISDDEDSESEQDDEKSPPPKKKDK